MLATWLNEEQSADRIEFFIIQIVHFCKFPNLFYLAGVFKVKLSVGKNQEILTKSFHLPTKESFEKWSSF